MSAVLAGNSPWVVSLTDPSPALEIALLKQTVILSWSQFVFAEGGSDEVRIAFATHDVIVKGAGLEVLLPAIAAHRVVSLRESVRSERFSGQAGRFISEIVVRKIAVE